MSAFVVRIFRTCGRRDSIVRLYCTRSKTLAKDGLILELGTKKAQKRVGEASKKQAGGSSWMLILPAFAFSLGCWQVYRLQWKRGLLEQLKLRLEARSVQFPIDNLDSLGALEYHRVQVTGEFLHDREFTISPRGRFDPGHSQKDAGSLLSDDNLSSHGAHVITPFRVHGSNLVILINRGWVPMHLMSRESRMRSEPRGTVTIEAIVRKSEPRPQFMSANVPEQGVWFYKDLKQMAQTYDTAPIMLDAVYDASSIRGEPIGGQTNISIRNDHLSYLITWYSLSAVTLAMWFARFRK